CAIGYEAARMVLQGVQGFREDYIEHVTHGRCISGLKHAIPCTDVCPAHVDVPGYIALVKDGRNEDAVRLIRKDNPFPSVCGYVCEHPCEDRCRRHMVDDAVNICGIKRYAVDHAGYIPVPECAESTGKKVAIVGGGPGGLTTAYYLTLMGHKTVVYEQRHKLGGMLRYGIPDYRLPQDVLDKDIQYILDTGVETVMDTSVGEDITMEDLKREYDAVYISIGAHDDKKLRVPGEESNNVVSAVHMLRSIGEGDIPNLEGKRVCVIGGGNVAMDATRTSLRLGAERVTCIYRRRIEDMTALTEEIQEAQAEGGEILTLHAPDHIEADENGNVAAIWVQPQIISNIDNNGRTTIRKAEKDCIRIPCDYVVVAIGQAIHSKHFETSGIDIASGVIKAEKSTFVPGSGNVFAGGDAVSGPSTVIRAVAAGKVAADNIDEFLGYQHKISVDVDVPPSQLTNSPACGRVNLASRGIENIRGDFDLVSMGMSEQEVKQECGRCLRCDHFGYGIFKGGRTGQW
ncbi:MAG: NAD(P)-binding protein, partial [Lachnospirales bacterium]